MRRYQSHKVVEAAPLVDIIYIDVSRDHDTENVAGYYAQVEGGMGVSIKLPDNFGARGWPSKGDYIVRYQPDGYLSWSPKDKFEDGYTAVGD